MIRTIVFDFDGIILESTDIKTEAFRELFRDYPKKLNEIVKYHIRNGGISRYVKFRYIYKEILEEELTRKREAELGELFSQIALDKILKAPFVVGAKEFLDRNRDRYQLFIVSGTPEEELRDIIYARGLHGYFKEIHGSPTKKRDVLNDIIRRYELTKDNLVYVGDAESDRIAASEAGVIFIERQPGFDSETKTDHWIIRDLSLLDKILEKIDSQNKLKIETDL